MSGQLNYCNVARDSVLKVVINDHNPQLKYVGDTGPDPEEEENGAGPRGQRGRRHQL